MVMRNRHDGPGGPDELPPRVRARMGPPSRLVDVFDGVPAEPAPPPVAAGGLARLAVLFLLVAVANALFLLVALSFVAGGPAPAVLMPGR